MKWKSLIYVIKTEGKWENTFLWNDNTFYKTSYNNNIHERVYIKRHLFGW